MLHAKGTTVLIIAIGKKIKCFTISVSGYACNHGSLRIGNETLRPLEGARGTPSACPVSEA